GRLAGRRGGAEPTARLERGAGGGGDRSGRRRPGGGGPPQAARGAGTTAGRPGPARRGSLRPPEPGPGGGAVAGSAGRPAGPAAATGDAADVSPVPETQAGRGRGNGRSAGHGDGGEAVGRRVPPPAFRGQPAARSRGDRDRRAGRNAAGRQGER